MSSAPGIVVPAPTVADAPALAIVPLSALPGTAVDVDQEPPPADPQQIPPQSPQKNPANPQRPWWRIFNDIGSDFAHLPSKDNASWLLTGSIVTLIASPVDKAINQRFHGGGFVDVFFDPGKFIGYGVTQFAVAFTTWEWGRVHKQPRVVHLGVDLLRAQVVAQALTYGLKYAVRRERPDGTGYSFPSGHASVTFASATVLQRHLGWKYALPTYTLATYVAVSRLHENRHYLSDVIFGSTVGIISGRTVTRHGRDEWGIIPVTEKGTTALLITRTW
ncbi:MAG TPA: phosphatase PAP2 family protein [Vicinamibacterales bacterium]|nr:phosphatase PAP2 family protein [Vicinamibacterales bacterium]